jgi:O-antigen/teichoic acid export membrane protein
MLLIGQAVVQGSSMVLGILVARTFGDAGYGRYSLAFAFVSLFGLLFSLGADSIVIREVARDPAQASKVFGGGLWLRLGSFPVALLVIGVGAWIAGYDPEQRQLVLLAALAIGLSSGGDLFRAVFQGQQRMQLDTLTRGTEKIVAVLLLWPLVKLLPGLEAVMLAVITGAVVGLALSWVILPRLIGRITLPRPRQGFQLLKEAAPLAGSMVLIALNASLPPVILSRFRSYGDIGLYSAAYNITGSFALIPLAFAGALLPALSGLFKTGTQSTSRFYRSLIAYMLALSAPATVVLIWLAEDIVGVLYGGTFAPAAASLKIQAFFVPLVFLSTYLANVLIASGSQRSLLKVSLLNLGLTIGLSLWLIPTLGVQGASLTRVLAPCGGIGLLLIYTWRWIKSQWNRNVVVVVVATALMVGAAYALQSTAIMVRVPVAMGLYGLGLWIGGVLRLPPRRVSQQR